MHGPYENKELRDKALIRLVYECSDQEKLTGMSCYLAYVNEPDPEPVSDGSSHIYEVCVAEVHYSYRQATAKAKGEALRKFDKGEYEEVQCCYNRELEDKNLCVEDIQFIE
jgi:hypothetical protein